jgi:hypothetical protein
VDCVELRDEALRPVVFEHVGADPVPLLDAEHHAFENALVRSLERDELLRALALAVDGLPREAVDVADVAAKVEPRLRELTA